MAPLPLTLCQMKWNWSLVAQMSLPPPWMAQAPPLSAWPPAGLGPPMSAQLHPLGHTVGSGVGVAVLVAVATLVFVAVGVAVYEGLGVGVDVMVVGVVVL